MVSHGKGARRKERIRLFHTAADGTRCLWSISKNPKEKGPRRKMILSPTGWKPVKFDTKELMQVLQNAPNPPNENVLSGDIAEIRAHMEDFIKKGREGDSFFESKAAPTPEVKHEPKAEVPQQQPASAKPPEGTPAASNPAPAPAAPSPAPQAAPVAPEAPKPEATVENPLVPFEQLSGQIEVYRQVPLGNGKIERAYMDSHGNRAVVLMDEIPEFHVRDKVVYTTPDGQKVAGEVYSVGRGRYTGDYHEIYIRDDKTHKVWKADPARVKLKSNPPTENPPTNGAFARRVADTGKVSLAPAFVDWVRKVAAENGLTEDDVWAKWQKYSKDCDAMDQSPSDIEFLQWNNLKGDGMLPRENPPPTKHEKFMGTDTEHMYRYVTFNVFQMQALDEQTRWFIVNVIFGEHRPYSAGMVPETGQMYATLGPVNGYAADIIDKQLTKHNIQHAVTAKAIDASYFAPPKQMKMESAKKEIEKLCEGSEYMFPEQAESEYDTCRELARKVAKAEREKDMSDEDFEESVNFIADDLFDHYRECTDAEFSKTKKAQGYSDEEIDAMFEGEMDVEAPPGSYQPEGSDDEATAWVEKHSVNCIKCGKMFDERDGVTPPDGEGTLCPACQEGMPEDENPPSKENPTTAPYAEYMTLFKGDRWRFPSGIIYVIGDHIKDEFGIAVEMINEETGAKHIADLEKTKKLLKRQKAVRVSTTSSNPPEKENPLGEYYEGLPDDTVLADVVGIFAKNKPMDALTIMKEKYGAELWFGDNTWWNEIWRHPQAGQQPGGDLSYMFCHLYQNPVQPRLLVFVWGRIGNAMSYKIVLPAKNPPEAGKRPPRPTPAPAAENPRRKSKGGKEMEVKTEIGGNVMPVKMIVGLSTYAPEQHNKLMEEKYHGKRLVRCAECHRAVSFHTWQNEPVVVCRVHGTLNYAFLVTNTEQYGKRMLGSMVDIQLFAPFFPDAATLRERLSRTPRYEDIPHDEQPIPDNIVNDVVELYKTCLASGNWDTWDEAVNRILYPEPSKMLDKALLAKALQENPPVSPRLSTLAGQYWKELYGSGKSGDVDKERALFEQFAKRHGLKGVQRRALAYIINDEYNIHSLEDVEFEAGEGAQKQAEKYALAHDNPPVEVPVIGAENGDADRELVDLEENGAEAKLNPVAPDPSLCGRCFKPVDASQKYLQGETSGTKYHMDCDPRKAKENPPDPKHCGVCGDVVE